MNFNELMWEDGCSTKAPRQKVPYSNLKGFTCAYIIPKTKYLERIIYFAGTTRFEIKISFEDICRCYFHEEESLIKTWILILSMPFKQSEIIR